MMPVAVVHGRGLARSQWFFMPFLRGDGNPWAALLVGVFVAASAAGDSIPLSLPPTCMMLCLSCNGEAKETNLYGFVAIIDTELIRSSVASMSPLN